MTTPHQPVIPPATTGDRIREARFKAATVTGLSLSLLVLAVLIIDVVIDGKGRLSLDLINSFPSTFPKRAGIESALIGTIWLMVICAFFVIPVGIATAIYLEDYADGNRWYNRILEINIQNLAAVPSIVYGILGLAFLVRSPLSLGRSVLAGALTLGLLVLPIIIIASRESLRAVPSSIKEGSVALGATQWQAIWRQTLPAAVPGIATGSILALSRAIGETAPLIMVGAATYVAFNPTGLDSSFTALPLQIYQWLSMPQPAFKELAAAAIIVLLIVLMSMNAVAIWLRNRFERKW